jgi:hypothetical protein
MRDVSSPGGSSGQPKGPFVPAHEEDREAAEPSNDHQDILARQLEELQAEIRVVLPGVAVFFGFLLTLPFASGFQTITPIDRGVYFIAFLSTALAMILLMAQAAYHRLRGKPYNKRLMLRTANRQTIAAIALLMIAMPAVVFLVTDVVYVGRVALPLSAGIFAFALAIWFFLPIVRRVRRDR